MKALSANHDVNHDAETRHVNHHQKSHSTKLGYLMVFLGFLACPCHLPLTIPLVLTMLASVGIIAHFTTIDLSLIIIMIVLSFFIFFALMAIGFRLIKYGRIKEAVSCPACQATRTTQQ